MKRILGMLGLRARTVEEEHFKCAPTLSMESLGLDKSFELPTRGHFEAVAEIAEMIGFLHKDVAAGILDGAMAGARMGLEAEVIVEEAGREMEMAAAAGLISWV